MSRVSTYTSYRIALSCKKKVCEFNEEMQQSGTIDQPRHREEEAKNDNRSMTSTEFNKSKATSSLFLNSLNLIASVSGRQSDQMPRMVNQCNTHEIVFCLSFVMSA